MINLLILKIPISTISIESFRRDVFIVVYRLSLKITNAPPLFDLHTRNCYEATLNNILFLLCIGNVKLGQVRFRQLSASSKREKSGEWGVRGCHW